MGVALELEGLSKHFGDVVALDSVDLEVPEGSVFGFLGPNGAGKTTALRILNGLARPTTGRATVFGTEAGSIEARSMVGFLPDVPGFYPWMTGVEFLRFSGGLFGLSRAELDARVPPLLDMAGLDGLTARVGGYSRGMRQRLGIAQALVNAPRLLMLDEPTSALDPVGRKDVLDMISALAGRTTVFFSTHILSDVERVCDRIAVLDKGRVVVEGPMDEVRAAHSAHVVEFDVEGAEDRIEAVLRAAPWVRDIDRADSRFTVTVDDMPLAGRDIPSTIVEHGGSLVAFRRVEPTLEDVFIEVTSHSGPIPPDAQGAAT